MKKLSIIILLFVICLTGCKDKKVECTYDKEEDSLKTHIKIALIEKDDIVEKEELYSEYEFKSDKDADKNYEALQKKLEQDDSIKIEQKDGKIIAQGEKDVTDMKYDKEAKVDYYEKLGYTCK